MVSSLRPSVSPSVLFGSVGPEQNLSEISNLEEISRPVRVTKFPISLARKVTGQGDMGPVNFRISDELSLKEGEGDTDSEFK